MIIKLIEWTMKVRKYLDNEVDNDDFEVDHMYVRKYLGKNYPDHKDENEIGIDD